MTKPEHAWRVSVDGPSAVVARLASTISIAEQAIHPPNVDALVFRLSAVGKPLFQSTWTHHGQTTMDEGCRSNTASSYQGHNEADPLTEDPSWNSFGPDRGVWGLVFGV